MTDWQPIETAPKDGTLILGYYPAMPPHHFRMLILKWKRKAFAAAGGSSRELVSKPTHWMPLPEPPQAA